MIFEEGDEVICVAKPLAEDYGDEPEIEVGQKYKVEYISDPEEDDEEGLIDLEGLMDSYPEVYFEHVDPVKRKLRPSMAQCIAEIIKTKKEDK